MRIFLLIILFLSGSPAYAKKIDYIVLKNITGSKWTLAEEKKSGEKADKNPARQEIIFTTGSILFDSDDQHYQCNYTLKKKVEFWLYCAEPDQYIYKVKALTRNVLVMDVYAKTKSGKFVKKKSLTYKRINS